MSLTWHIVRKDLRRFRWPLALWALLIASKFLIGLALLWPDESAELSRFSRLASLARTLSMLEWTSLVLVAAIVLEDPLVGTRANWLTRPIAPSRLLAAKAITLVLSFIALPVLVALPWWLLCEYNSAQILAAAVETVDLPATFGLAMWLFAAVAENLPQALGRAIIGVGIFWAALFAFFLLYRPPEYAGVPSFARWGVGFALVAGALIVFQTFTRRTLLTLSAVCCVLMLAPWASRWMTTEEEPPPPIAMSRESVLTSADFQDPWPEKLRVTSSSVQLKPSGPSGRFRPDSAALLMAIEVEGLAENEWLRLHSIELEARWPDGKSSKANMRQPWTAAFELQDALAAYDGSTGGNLSKRRRSVDAFDLLTSGSTEAWMRSASWTRKAFLRLQRLEQGDPESPWDRWIAGERIGTLRKDGKEARVLIVRRQPDFGRWAKPQGPSLRQDVDTLRLVQPQLGNVFQRRRTSQATRIGTVELSWFQLRFLPSDLRRFGVEPRVGPVSFDGAKLVRLRVVEGPRFVLEDTIEDTAATLLPPEP